ncbi:MAG: hypothetical protein ACYCS1_11855 [Gammaproteobacteria bacterium]
MEKCPYQIEGYEAVPFTIYSPMVTYPAQGARRIPLVWGATPEEVAGTGAELRREALRLTWHIEHRGLPPSKLNRLFEDHPGLLTDPEILERCGKLVRSSRFRRGQGQRALKWRQHPLVIHALVTEVIETGRAQSVRDACEELAESLHLESSSIRKLYYQAQNERRFSPYLVVHPDQSVP